MFYSNFNQLNLQQGLEIRNINKQYSNKLYLEIIK